MNIQTVPTSQAPSVNEEHRPKGKLVIPQEHRNSKEYPKEKFYSFLKAGVVDKFVNTKFGEMDLNNKKSSSVMDHKSTSQSNNSFRSTYLYDDSPFEPSCGIGSFRNSNVSLRDSSGSFSLPKILEGSSSHEQLPHKRTIFPDIAKFYEDSDDDDDSDTSDDSDDESSSDSEFESETTYLRPLNDEKDEEDTTTDYQAGMLAEEQPSNTTPLDMKASTSSHSLYERLDSNDDGSDWEVVSDDDSILSC